jgi:acylpyruvate hydrolase
MAKAFDTACPVSFFIPKDSIPDPQNVNLWCKVNGEMKQNGNTKDMIFNIPYLLSYISQFFTLEPNDVVLTGTPAGVSPVKDGDVIEAGLANMYNDDIIQIKFEVEQKK